MAEIKLSTINVPTYLAYCINAIKTEEKKFVSFEKLQKSKKLIDPLINYSIPKDKGRNDYLYVNYVQDFDKTIGYLDFNTKKSLVAAVEKELVFHCVDVLLDNGFDLMIKNLDLSNLNNLFMLFSKVSTLEKLYHAISEYTKKTGNEIIQSSLQNPQKMIGKLLILHQNLQNVLIVGFENDQRAVQEVKKASQIYINTLGGSRVAEGIARYMDLVLRRKLGGTESGQGLIDHINTEQDVEKALGELLMLFRFLQGKDVFEAFFQKDLSKRLLMAKSWSIESERNLLIKLKNECGPQFTSKLEGMFKDIEISKENTILFKKTAFNKALNGIDLHATILSSAFWPSYPTLYLLLPPEIANLEKQFSLFYDSKFKSRKLTFQNNLGSVVLSSEFGNGQKKELNLSVSQAIILLLFNDSKSLSRSQIHSKTLCPEKELDRVLFALTNGKHQILLLDDSTKEFCVNENFESSLFRIKVSFAGAPQAGGEKQKASGRSKNGNKEVSKEELEEMELERVEINKRVLEDRKVVVEAMIVRIMKAKKKMDHKTLVGDVFEGCKFSVQASDVKTRIEGLIEREYLARDEKDSSVYIYLA